MVGSGQLPKFRDNLYHDAEDDLWLIPTAEVVLVNMHGDEILAPVTCRSTTARTSPASGARSSRLGATCAGSSGATSSTRSRW